MSRNYYSEINLHMVWHTKLSQPMLTPEVEVVTYQSLTNRALATPNVQLYAIGGIETHVHMVVTVPPTLLISHWIGQLKAGSSHEVNRRLQGNSLQWQTGYGVVTFGTRDLPWVVKYVRSQKEHHARDSSSLRLEFETLDPADPTADMPASGD